MLIVEKLSVETGDKCEFIEITSRLKKLVDGAEIEEGALLVSIPHTTAAVTVNESYDSSVRRDIVSKLNDIVPFQGSYTHREGNSPAHIKSTIVGSDQLIPIEDGSLVLGTWQGVFFCEFDGPRNRNVHLQFLDSPL